MVFLLLVFPWAIAMAEARKPITKAQAMEIARKEFIGKGWKSEDITEVRAEALDDNKGWYVWVDTDTVDGHAGISISPKGKVLRYRGGP